MVLNKIKILAMTKMESNNHHKFKILPQEQIIAIKPILRTFLLYQAPIRAK